MTSTTGASDDNVLDTSARTPPSAEKEPTARDEFLAILAQALDREANDIFLKHGETTGKVKARANETLTTLATVGPEKLRQFINITAAAAGLQPHQIKHQPATGRVAILHKKKRTECRVIFLPDVAGVSASIQMPNEPPSKLPVIGYEPEQLSAIRRALKREPGLIVIAGPTLSGKSSSAEALLNEIDNAGNLSVFQISNVIEFKNDTRTQIEVGKNVTWKSALEGALNFRPDVIDVGNVHTTEQASLTVEAAVRGPFVICTLHATSAASAITRLQRMGIEGHQLSAALRLVISQRLARQFCDRCRYVYRTSFLPPRDSTTQHSETTFVASELAGLAGTTPDSLALNIIHEVVDDLWREHERGHGHSEPPQESILRRAITGLRDYPQTLESKWRLAHQIAAALERRLDPREAPTCQRCSQRGMRGRTVIAEVLEATPEIGAQLERLANGDRIVKHAVAKDGLLTMSEVEKRKVARGLLPQPPTGDEGGAE